MIQYTYYAAINIITINFVKNQLNDNDYSIEVDSRSSLQDICGFFLLLQIN
jgi:hypothetical protein